MTLDITTEWSQEAGGDLAVVPGAVAEDEASLSEIRIQVGETLLTRALDVEMMEMRDGGTLSAYRLAEWLTWNWWRLRWEPAHHTTPSLNWRQAHDLATIGGGWLWPHLTIRSDGIRVLVDATPSRELDTEPLRYLTNATRAISADDFESGVDCLVERVLVRLDKWSLSHTDLRTTWDELTVERNDPESALFRRLEAILGFDVDEAEPPRIEQVIEDGRSLGIEAMSEVVADQPLTAEHLRHAARTQGFDANPTSGTRPPTGSVIHPQGEAPWRIGTNAARSLRQREHLGDGPIADRRLAELYGVRKRALHDMNTSIGGPLAFALGGNGIAGTRNRVVLRSKWRVGRRFEIARLLADRVLVADNNERLRPVTRAYTYRQKMQRAFAAELLCPFTGLAEFLNEDLSDESREEAAAEYGVSSLAVTSILANNGLLEQAEIREPDLRF